MMTSLSPLARRAVAIGLLMLVMLLAEAAIVSPALDWQASVTARIAGAEMLLARTRAATAEADAAAETTAGGAPDLAGDVLLAAGEDSLAAAQLQTVLRAAAMAEAVGLASMQVEPASVTPGARRVTIRATLETQFAPLLRLMQRLEGGRPVLRLRGLEVQATDLGEDPRLSATLDVTALMATPAP